MANGKPGAPKGNKNAKGRHAGRRWTQAIDKALKQYKYTGEARHGHALDEIAKRLVEMAVEGDLNEFKFAVQTMGDRIEGKATEHKVVESTVTNKHGGISEAAGILESLVGQPEDDVDEGVVSH